MRLRRAVAGIVAATVLSGCGSAPSAQNVANHDRRLEATACKLISTVPSPPPTDSSSFEAISVQTSTLLALQKTDDPSLRAVVRNYQKAARSQDTEAMARALNHGVKVCHALGMKTGT